MTFLTGKHVDRRTLLRGIGSTIALPLLDAMCPALAAPAKLRKNFPPRIAVVYVPNGIVMNQWNPGTTGSDFQFTRILKPLEPFRQDITLLSGLANQAANQAKGAATLRQPAASSQELSRNILLEPMFMPERRSIKSSLVALRGTLGYLRYNSDAKIPAWSATAIPDRVAHIPTHFPGKILIRH